jgi:isopentenyldiphosphate isomerase/intracellular septation protein A
MDPKLELVKKLLPGFIPLLIFIIADEIWGTKIGLIVAVAVGIAEFVYTYWREKRLDSFILLDTVLLVGLGAVSLLLDNEIFFKLKPAVIQTIFCLILAISVFSPRNLLLVMSKRYMKGAEINNEAEKKFNQSLRALLFIFLFHTALVYYSAYFMSKEAWGFISGGLFYILFAVYFVIEFLRNRFFNKIADEILPLVDEEGRVTGKATRAQCHADKSLMHPVVHLHVVNEKKQIYLQKRPETKLIQPGKWDTAVGGHVGFGEDLEKSLEREAFEEIGIKNFKAQLVAKYKWQSDVETELVFMFITQYDDEIFPDKEELADGKFWDWQEVKRSLRKNVFTPNFEHEFLILEKMIK